MPGTALCLVVGWARLGSPHQWSPKKGPNCGPERPLRAGGLRAEGGGGGGAGGGWEGREFPFCWTGTCTPAHSPLRTAGQFPDTPPASKGSRGAWSSPSGFPGCLNAVASSLGLGREPRPHRKAATLRQARR